MDLHALHTIDSMMVGTDGGNNDYEDGCMGERSQNRDGAGGIPGVAEDRPNPDGISDEENARGDDLHNDDCLAAIGTFHSPSDNGSNDDSEEGSPASPIRNFSAGHDNYGVPPIDPGAAAAMGMSAPGDIGVGEGGAHPYGTMGNIGMGGAGGVAMGTMGERQDSAATHASESQGTHTATLTHEIRMPMMLSTFKPATGCTDASDFIVRCFVARLRAGITVVKHGRSRWCKSRLRILHVHADGRSLSWKPALGEPSSGKRPPKLDLSSCREVRHAWSPDPENPMFTGTPILRQKCEAANAHKSFALVFPKRTVDITAVTADQCKVLMEGFSALCFRLQVANMANMQQGGKREEEEDRATTTASVTLTNTSLSVLSPEGASPSNPELR